MAEIELERRNAEIELERRNQGNRADQN